MSAELLRHVNALVADFAADYGEVDLVGRRVDCEATARDAIQEAFEAYGVVGGAGLRVRDDRGRVLLVRYRGADGWVDPGDGRRPGESFRECARRGIDEAAGLDANVSGLAQIHLLYMDDPTDRDPLPNPYVSFEGRLRDGEATPDDVHPGDGVADVRWADEPPCDLLYDELAELPLGE